MNSYLRVSHIKKIFILCNLIVLATLLTLNEKLYAQDAVASDSSKKIDPLVYQYDISDLFSDILHPNRRVDSFKTKSGLAFLPNVAYNPSIGAQIGVKAVGGKILGKQPSETLMSVAASSASITTRGILVFYISHNVFTPGNKWNLQGNWRVANMVALDHGLGIGNKTGENPNDNILLNPDRELYMIRYHYYTFNEKVYKQVYPNLFLGAGISFDIRERIQDERLAEELTPHYLYSQENGFNNNHYVANGLLFDIQYTTRDHPNRAYKGIHSDIGIRLNQAWLGSNKSSVQITTDFRKYWSLSERNPEHVLAFWHWGSYLLSGTLPYLELPGTGKDIYNRSGRGYTIGYYNGTSFFYSEIEYRFPITRNKFLGGATFINMQTAGHQLDTKLFQQWQPAAGFGLRVLFNKSTRTNLCLDYAFGRYGSSGFFLGLNEAF